MVRATSLAVCGFLALGLAACGSSSSNDMRPMNVDNGVGAQYGNYAAQPGGTVKGPDGKPCEVFNWDRPIGNGQAIRVRSASCPDPDHPGSMISHEISRDVISLSDSTLAPDQEGAAPDDAAPGAASHDSSSSDEPGE